MNYSQDPIVYELRSGKENDEFVQINESRKIIHNKVLLSELPDRENKVLINGLIELPNLNLDEPLIGINEYYVNYTTGEVFFHPSQEGQTVTISFWGRGLVFIPTSRIYRPTDTGNGMEILEGVIEQAKEAIENISDVEEVIDEANLSIQQANTARDAANTAANAANTATTNANIATNAATTATTNAITARDAANVAAAQANTARDSANIAATNANNAANELVNKGNYSASSLYKVRNMVYYDGATYMCILNTTAGIAPTNATYWKKITAFSWKGVYSSATVYQYGDFVADSVNQKLYMCVLDGTTNIALSNTTNWKLLVDVSGAVTNANNAATAATTAKTNADTATAQANTARDAANTATTNANNAATAANAAKDAANTATTQANASRDAANTATTAANTAAEDANEARMDIEANEATRIAAEGARNAAETTRGTNETIRANAESTRVSQESARVTAETSRANAETTRATNETNRATAETGRANAESLRVSAESSRVSAESARVTTEGLRVTAESTRASAESSRVSSENARISAENNRNDSEDDRESAESLRATSESTRQSQESTRQSNETTRQSQETARQTNTTTAITNANNAATALNALVSNTKGVGTYNPSTAYKPNNFVAYNGSTWMALVNVTGVTPATGASQWQLIAQRGVDGAGSVVSVNGKSPDVSGNVALVASDIGAETPSGAQAKADAVNTSLTNHIGSGGNAHADATTSSDGFMTAAMVTKLNGIAANANNYSHPTGAGNNHIPTGGASGQFLKYSSSGTATWSSPAKTDVGLGSVENYGIASQAEAEAGAVTNKYMTPLRVAQAIEALGGSGSTEVTRITTNTDLDSLTTVGRYWCAIINDSPVITNMPQFWPTTSLFLIDVESYDLGSPYGAMIVQKAYGLEEGARDAFRTNIGGNWNDFSGGAWGANMRVASESDVQSGSDNIMYITPRRLKTNLDWRFNNFTLNAEDVATTGGTDVQSEINSLKSSVSDGKTLVAGAITDKGVNTPANATFQVMADNIESISGEYLPSAVWKLRSTPNDNIFTSVCYGNNLFVAVASSGTGNRVMTSPDGITWTARTTPVDNNWSSVCYGNGMFVAVANSGTSNTNKVMTSLDGITWTVGTTPANNSAWTSVCYGNGMFVAVANSGTNRAMLSPDGITWTLKSMFSKLWSSVCYGNGQFVAVSETGDRMIARSPDGLNWTGVTLPSSSSIDSGSYIYYWNEMFIAVGKIGTESKIMTSVNGTNWTVISVPANRNWRSICHGFDMFVIVGTGNQVMTSLDGFTWELRSIPSDSSWTSVCYGNGQFVAVSNSGTGNRVMTSGIEEGSLGDYLNYVVEGKDLIASAISDKGIHTEQSNSFLAIADNIKAIITPYLPGENNWQIKNAVDGTWQSVCYGNGLFVAVANQDSLRKVMTSSNGRDWVNVPLTVPASGYWWSSVCYGNGLFVAVAISNSNSNGNQVITSPDGVNWTLRSTPTDSSWTSVCYGNGQFVAVGGLSNHVMTSPDGITWTSRTAFANSGWRSVCYGNGLFVAVTGSGIGNRAMTSPDGITWTLRSTPVDNNWSSVCYGNGLFVAVSDSGIGNRVMTSPDGITWTIRNNPTDHNWRSVCYGNGLFVAVASGSSTLDRSKQIMTSHNGTTWISGLATMESYDWSSVCYGSGMFVAIASYGTGIRRVMASDAGEEILSSYFKNVSDGLEDIAAALREKGKSAMSQDSFATLANIIRSL